jgi:LPS sulfotransferase NodH
VLSATDIRGCTESNLSDAKIATVARKEVPLPFDERWAQHGVADPERIYLVAGVQRSGSSLLASGLRATGRFGVPFEYFVRDAIGFFGRQLHVLPLSVRGRLRLLRRRLRGDGPWPTRNELSPAILSDYVAGLQRIRTTHNGVFGVKVLYTQLIELRREWNVDIVDLVQPRRIIFITRQDHLRQAVSFVRAIDSGVWNADRPIAPVPPPSFDRSRIEALVRQIEAGEAGWRERLSRYRGPVHEITYEELDADYEGVMAGCFAFLGDPDVPVPPRTTYRLADAVTEEWIARLAGTPWP